MIRGLVSLIATIEQMFEQDVKVIYNGCSYSTFVNNFSVFIPESLSILCVCVRVRV